MVSIDIILIVTFFCKSIGSLPLPDDTNLLKRNWDPDCDDNGPWVYGSNREFQNDFGFGGPFRPSVFLNEGNRHRMGDFHGQGGGPHRHHGREKSHHKPANRKKEENREAHNDIKVKQEDTDVSDVTILSDDFLDKELKRIEEEIEAKLDDDDDDNDEEKEIKEEEKEVKISQNVDIENSTQRSETEDSFE